MEIFSTESLIYFIKSVGYLGLFAIVFAESGLLIGFFLPGDSLLFTAGFLASQGFLNLLILNLIVIAGAIIGDNVGYSFGYKVGPKIFKQKDSRVFHQDNLRKAEEFYEKYGGKTIILARFMPFIRTFAPIVAGAGKMNYKKFLFYNVIGGILWTLTLTFLGYYLGRVIPNVDRYILPIILLLVVGSVLPTLLHFVLGKETQAEESKTGKK